MATVGDRIRQVRQQNGITQDDLAAAADTTKQNIYKYEKNIITNIPMDKITLIASRLEVSPAWLMGWSDADQSSRLSSDESSLLSTFRSLSSEGQRLMLATAQSFATNPTYQKNTDDQAI